MKKNYRYAILLLTLLITFIAVPVASAHPLGNFTINHYAGLQIKHDRINVDFVLDMAEIPAFQEIAKFDANHNGQPDADESANYQPAQCEALRPQLSLSLNGLPLTLQLDSSSIAFPSGAGGLLTLRLMCEYSTPIVLTDQKAQLEFADQSYADRIGWREIVVTSDSVALEGTYTSTSISKRLTAYPTGMLTDPLNQRQITLVLNPTSVSSQMASSPVAQTNSSLDLTRSDAFTQLITLKEVTPLTFLFALLVAFIWGALHAVTPGHGKTIVGAYLVGSRGTAKHALFLGLTTTITHTAGVFALGLVTLLAARFIVPEQVFPWLSILSGLLVAIIGLRMLLTRFRDAKLFPQLDFTHPDHQHDHRHAESFHVHTHADHDHAEELEHSHDDHHHAHDHDEGHSHTHEHGESHSHSHLPPGTNGEPVTWRSILALGISGGILPCPSALIVLLSAIALGRVAFGLVLVLAFSAGLAGVLSGIGILFVYAGRLFQLSSKQGWLLRALPVASALVITLAGLGITLKALTDMGLIKI